MKKMYVLCFVVVLILFGCTQEEPVPFSVILDQTERTQLLANGRFLANDWYANHTYLLNEQEKQTLFDFLEGEYKKIDSNQYQKKLQDEQNELPYSFLVKRESIDIIDVLIEKDRYSIAIEKGNEEVYLLEITQETFASIQHFVSIIEYVCSPETPCPKEKNMP